MRVWFLIALKWKLVKFWALKWRKFDLYEFVADPNDARQGIQNAIDFAAATHANVVVIPEGVWTLDAPLDTEKIDTLQGDSE